MTSALTRPAPQAIETERLLIRLPLPGDGAEVNTAIRETFDELHVWMDWAQHLPTVQETEEHIQRAHTDFVTATDFPYFAFLKASDTFVLATGLHPKDWAVPKFEIGYWCRASLQGQGYVTEAIRKLTSVGFEVMEANRIEIRCEPRNLRSRRVAERAGFHLEAVLRNDKRRPDRELRDTLVYSLLPPGYEP